MTLNAEQQLAVELWHAFIVVVAGPGSGKTRTLIERIIRLVTVTMVDPHRIIVLTFTNAAAHELASRLKMSGITLGYIGTLHGYCYRMVQRFSESVGYRSGRVAILPEKEKETLFRATMERLGRKLTQAQLAARDTPDAELIWSEFGFELRRNNLVTFDGVLRDAVTLLKLPHVREYLTFDHLMVDEYQDSAKIDQQIYDLLPTANRFVVGDPDQSIYAFRGAHPEGFVERAQRTDVAVIKLETNYRCDQVLALAANHLIAHNVERVEKKIVPISQEIGHVKVMEFEDTYQELDWIAGQIRTHPDCKIAILARLNYDARRAAEFCLARGIKVQRSFAPEVNLKEWERALLLLSLCVSPENDLIAEQFLRLEFPGGGQAVRVMKLRATDQGVSLAKFAGIGGWPLTFNEFPRFLAERGITDYTIRYIKQRMALLSVVEPTLADLLSDLYSHEDWRQSRHDDDGVFVGTLHSAKGKEWDVVFLTAFEDDVIPSAKECNIEEERRLAFVGLTRARHEVLITHASVRSGQWDTSMNQRPSRFIEEMAL